MSLPVWIAQYISMKPVSKLHYGIVKCKKKLMKYHFNVEEVSYAHKSSISDKKKKVKTVML